MLQALLLSFTLHQRGCREACRVEVNIDTIRVYVSVCVKDKKQLSVQF